MGDKEKHSEKPAFLKLQFSIWDLGDFFRRCISLVSNGAHLGLKNSESGIDTYMGVIMPIIRVLHPSFAEWMSRFRVA